MDNEPKNYPEAIVKYFIGEHKALIDNLEQFKGAFRQVISEGVTDLRKANDSILTSGKNTARDLEALTLRITEAAELLANGIDEYFARIKEEAKRLMTMEKEIARAELNIAVVQIAGAAIISANKELILPEMERAGSASRDAIQHLARVAARTDQQLDKFMKTPNRILYSAFGGFVLGAAMSLVIGLLV